MDVDILMKMRYTDREQMFRTINAKRSYVKKDKKCYYGTSVQMRKEV